NAQSLLRKGYREGIQKTYQVFPDPQKRVPTVRRSFSTGVKAAADFLHLTTFDVEPVTFPDLSSFAQRAGLPGFVFNATVVPPRPTESAPLGQRIFELGAIGFGSDSCGYLAWNETEGLGWEPGDQAQDGWMWREFIDRRGSSPYATIRNFNTAPAISGAAIDA